MKEEQNKELTESINKYTKLAPLSFRRDILTKRSKWGGPNRQSKQNLVTNQIIMLISSTMEFNTCFENHLILIAI